MPDICYGLNKCRVMYRFSWLVKTGHLAKWLFFMKWESMRMVDVFARFFHWKSKWLFIIRWLLTAKWVQNIRQDFVNTVPSCTVLTWFLLGKFLHFPSEVDIVWGTPVDLHLIRPTVLTLLNSGLLYTCENIEDPRDLLFMWDICWYLYY